MGKKLFKKSLAWMLTFMMVITFMPMGMSFAAEGDIPDHAKTAKDNGDGTYTIALSVTGDSEQVSTVTPTNVIVILDVSGSMSSATGNGNETRLQAARSAVNTLADTLLSYNGKYGNANDAFELALVTFSTTATIARTPVTTYTEFSAAVNRTRAEGGTNWEDALQTANDVDFGDADQTFVIFVSDGNPTFRNTRGNYVPLDDYFVRNYGYTVYGNGSDTTSYQNIPVATTISRCYDNAVDDATELVTAGATLFAIGAYGNTDRMEDLVEDSGAKGYYRADNTQGLQQALNEILEEIKTAGISTVEMDDGTTSNVSTSSGEMHLLSVDTTSYKYYRSGGAYSTTANDGLGEEWAGAPAASFENGSVKWDLSSEGVLENGVTYTMTFVCAPGQDALDMIAAMENGASYEEAVPQEIREKGYLDEDGKLVTNTTATLSYTDTRSGESSSATFKNPEPVPTKADSIDIQKIWVGSYWNQELNDGEGAYENEQPITLAIFRDNERFDSITLDPDDSYKKNTYLAIGVLTVDKTAKTVNVFTQGHDYQLKEEGDISYHWEFQAETMHPMNINGTTTMLVVAENIPESVTTGYDEVDGVEYYKIGDKYYTPAAADGALSATNVRRSSFNLIKQVDGSAASEDAEFEYTIKMTLPKNVADDSTEKDLFYSLWVDGQYAEFDNSGEKELDEDGKWTGYYHCSDDTIDVTIPANANLRFTNILTGTEFEVVEKDSSANFECSNIEVTPEESESTPAELKPVIDVPNAKVSGTIVQGNVAYTVAYTNKYELGALRIKKIVEGDLRVMPRGTNPTFIITGPEGFEAQTISYSDFAEDSTYIVTNLTEEGNYTITESNANVPGYNCQTTYSTNSGVVEVKAGELKDITITNKYTKKVTPPPPPPPPDLNGEDHFAYIEGYPDGTVQPEGSITRAEVTTMIYRLLTEKRRAEIFTDACDYSDVEQRNWFNKAVSSMSVGEYINGYPNGSFKPNQAITRAEFVTIVVRFLEGLKDAENPFSDVDGHWALPYILSAVDAGWIDGYPDGTFKPNEPIKRCEAMKIMNTILHRGINEESELGEPVMFPDNADSSVWYYYEVIETTNNHETEGERPDEDWLSNECEYVYDIVKYERPE